MKPTKTSPPARKCPLCGGIMEVGSLGHNFQPDGIVGPVQRVHTKCLERLRRTTKFAERILP